VKSRVVGTVPQASADSLLPAQPSVRLQPTEAANALARLLGQRINGSTEQYRKSQNAAQQRLNALGSPHSSTTLPLQGALHLARPAFLPPDAEGYARLRHLDTSLRVSKQPSPKSPPISRYAD